MSDTPPPRVVSLLSATTEIVFSLGCGDMLVGRSHGCDWPPAALAVPPLTAPKVDPAAPSAVIDEAVRAQLARGGPVYHIFNDELRALRPDVILTQDQCRICAVTARDLRAALADGAADGAATTTIVTVQPVVLDDVLSDVGAVADALGVPARAAARDRVTAWRDALAAQHAADGADAAALDAALATAEANALAPTVPALAP